MGTNRQMRRRLYTLKKTKNKNYLDYNGVLQWLGCDLCNFGSFSNKNVFSKETSTLSIW